MDLSLIALAGALITSPLEAPATAPGPRVPAPRIAVATPAPPRPLQDVEYSTWYYRRLTVHRWGSYTMLPVFAAQFYVGTRLYGQGAVEEDGLKDVHNALALGVGALFTSNTITGVWNLWDGRKDPKDRGRKVTHALMMLAADAGFLTTAILGDEVEDNGAGRGTHRAVAIGSIVLSTTGWILMTDLFRSAK